jgi:hypothetical protein
MSKNRYYSHNVLETWIQGRCLICQRFLGLRQEKHCSRCRIKLQNEHIERWQKEHREEYLKQKREYDRNPRPRG